MCARHPVISWLVLVITHTPYLVPVCCPAITNSNIGTAVSLRCSDESSATATYGIPPYCTRLVYDSPIHPRRFWWSDNSQIENFVNLLTDLSKPYLVKWRFAIKNQVEFPKLEISTYFSVISYETSQTALN